jgi:hypothetical protein
MYDSACTHEQEPLIDNVRYGVRGRAVYGQMRAYTDSAYHKTDLAYNMMRQKSSHIVFKYSVDNRDDGDNSADPYQEVRSGITTGQAIDTRLSGKGAEKYSAVNTRLGIGVGTPRA